MRKIKVRFQEFVDRRFAALPGVSLVQIADETGLSYQTVLTWYNFQPRRIDLNTLAVFCDYFQCQPGDLIGLE